MKALALLMLASCGAPPPDELPAEEAPPAESAQAEEAYDCADAPPPDLGFDYAEEPESCWVGDGERCCWWRPMREPTGGCIGIMACRPTCDDDFEPSALEFPSAGCDERGY